MGNFHIPVMLDEVLLYLAVKKGHWYIDCNLGGGGHTQGILYKGGKVLGIDLDPDAIKEVANKSNLEIEEQDGELHVVSEKLILACKNFTYVRQIVTQLNLKEISGILFDLGVSSYQLDSPERGFSFNLDAPLDMRMDPNFGVSAQDLINGLNEVELIDLFWKLGEERFAKRIAKKIVEMRQKQKIQTTNQLAQIILSVRPRTKSDRTHPATRVFQALRIAVNDELNSLKEALPQALDVLSPGGRMVVISFHSLEDRIVKNFFRDSEQAGLTKILTKKPVTPTEEEIANNPRARSGKLRVAEKI